MPEKIFARGSTPVSQIFPLPLFQSRNPYTQVSHVIVALKV